MEALLQASGGVTHKIDILEFERLDGSAIAGLIPNHAHNIEGALLRVAGHSNRSPFAAEVSLEFLADNGLKFDVDHNLFCFVLFNRKQPNWLQLVSAHAFEGLGKPGSRLW